MIPPILFGIENIAHVVTLLTLRRLATALIDHGYMLRNHAKQIGMFARNATALTHTSDSRFRYPWKRVFLVLTKNHSREYGTQSEKCNIYKQL